MKPHLLFLPAMLLCFSCSGSKAQEATPAASDTLTTLMLPSIPVMLTTPEQRAQYLATHYWDLTNLADTHYIHHPEITEQGWVNFIDLLQLVSPQDAQKAFEILIRRADVEKKSLNYFLELAEKYLFEANSPYRNEEYFISVLQAVIKSPTLTETEKLRPKDLLNTVSMNRVGTQAHDFCYTLASGQQGRLHELSSPLTLLFFSNPECHACAEATEQLQKLKHLNQAIRNKKLTVLSVYPDEEVETWKSYASEYPAHWLVTYDKKQVIKDKNLYDLKAIPCLYLLDKDKKVILKDVTPEVVDTWLSEHP